jgi:DNA-binding transcriptional regulator YhcF (GntR family)
METITRKHNDYVNVLLANEDLLKTGVSLRSIALKYGLSYDYAHNVYKQLCRQGKLDRPYKRKCNSEKALLIEKLLTTTSRKDLKYIDIAKKVGVSREYVRQIKEILVDEGKLKPEKKSLFNA